MRYRSEIDGLRALAIVPVVLFHAGFSGFSGGFVGVDVFFVISGYLITLAIVAEHADGRFSLLRFYERRARRILPALFAVLAACLPFAWLWLAPADMQDFAISVAGVVTFTTNILAARFINYFGPSAEITPLVHFWSLAVEEQFYLIFPLFALLALRFGKSAFIALAVIIGIASFVWGHSFANRGVEGVFYWSTARAWELLIGVIAALLPAAKSGATAKSAFGLLGIGLIVFSILTLDGSTPFPAANATLAPIGAFLIIRNAQAGTVGARLLSLSVFTRIGLVSYSAYLWHQPILAFYRLHYGTVTPGTAVAAVLVTFGLAQLSWAYVEQPFRKRGGTASVSGRRLIAVFSFATVLSLALAAVTVQTKGFNQYFITYRINPADAPLLAAIERSTSYDPDKHLVDDGECRFWSPRFTTEIETRFKNCAGRFGKAVLILGDSHGKNIHNILAKSGLFPFQISIIWHGCRPVNAAPHCQYEDAKAFADRHSDQISVILFNQSGSYLMEDAAGRVESPQMFEPAATVHIRSDEIAGIATYLNALAEYAPTVWLGPFVEARARLSFNYQGAPTLRINPQSLILFARLDRQLQDFASQQSIWRYVSLVDAFALQPDFLLQGDCITYRDADHFSLCGEDILAAEIKAAPTEWLSLAQP